MFDSRILTSNVDFVNDIRAYKAPIKLCGKLTDRIMRDRYMKLDLAEKGNIAYPNIADYLS